MKNILKLIIKKLNEGKKEPDGDVMLIKRALSDLNRARRNFDMVVGEDNVELAILELNAAEKRYRNLIKEAKSNHNKSYDLGGELYLE